MKLKQILRAFILLSLTNFSWASDHWTKERVPLPFNLQKRSEIPYCLSQLHEINPTTRRTYTEDIFADFRDSYKKKYKQIFHKDFDGADPDIDEVFRTKFLRADIPSGRLDITSMDDSMLVYVYALRNKYNALLHDEQRCMSIKDIRSTVEDKMREHLSEWPSSIQDNLTSSLDDLFQKGGEIKGTSKTIFNPNVSVIKGTGDGIDVTFSPPLGKGFSRERGFYTNRIQLDSKFFDKWIFNNKMAPLYLFPDFPQAMHDFEAWLRQESYEHGGGVVTAGLYPGYDFEDHFFMGSIERLKTLLDSNWTCGQKLGMGSTSSYRSLTSSGEYCGSIVFADRPGFSEKFHAFVGEHPGTTILDIAGAIGANTLRYLNQNSVILNDINIHSLAVAYAFVDKFLPDNKQNLRLNSLPASQIKLPANSIQATFIGHLVKYLTGSEIDELFKNAYEFTKPGGQVFIAELIPENGWYNDAHNDEMVDPVKQKSELWPNEWGKLKPDTRISGSKANYFLHKVSIDDITNALERAGFHIVEKGSDQAFFWIIAEKQGPIA